MLSLLLILASKLLASGEVLTLINKTNVACVLTDESVYSSLYIASSAKKSIDIRRPTTKLTNWYEDDWNTTTNQDQNYYPITDIRWEDFPKIESAKINLNQITTSFSACFLGGRLILSASDDSSNMEFIHLTNNATKYFCQWSHYMVNGSQIWQLTEDFELKKAWEVSFKPRWLRFPTRNVLIKSQEYHFRYSESTTLSDATSYLNVSNIDTSNSTSLCISMFVSLDEDCHLDVILESGDTQQTRIQGFNGKSDPKMWKRVEISTERYGGSGKLIFFRTRDDHEGFGFWAVDGVHLCRPVFEISKFELKAAQKRNYSESSGDVLCRSLDLKEGDEGVLCDKVGFFGRNCELSCEKVLGPEFPFCEGYQICTESGNCESSWHYQGPDRDEEAAEATEINLHSTSAINFEKLESSTTYQTEAAPEIQNLTQMSSYFENSVQPFQVQTSQMSTKMSGMTLTLMIVSGLGVLTVASCVAIISYKRKKSEDPTYEEIYLLPSDPPGLDKDIKIEEFETHLKRAILGDSLRSEFVSIPNERVDICTAGCKNENVSKNRDRHVIPYDKTRVILRGLEEIDSSDYINASYIDGYNRPKAYIACQGPKFSTVNNFWRMIWQEQVETVIMATDFLEKDGSRSCADYWSPNLNSSCDFGKFVIKMTKEETFQNYVHRIFEVLCEDRYRSVRHFQLKWSCGVYPDDLIPIVKQLREVSKKISGPIVIHSSLGVNRSGVLIICDLALQMAEDSGNVNFSDLLKRMRGQRPHMINTIEYYKLAQLTVLELLIEKESPFRGMPDANMLIEEQMNFMKRLYWHDEALNIVSQIMSTSHFLIDGYTRRNQFLLRRQPKKEQISEFWETIMTQNIKYVVFLNTSINKLWPHQYEDSGKILNISHLGNIEMTPSYSLNQLLLLTCDATTKEVLKKTELFFFELKTWDPRKIIPNSTNDILGLLDDVMRISRLDDNPIVVASGSELNQHSLFVILFNAIEKYEKELEVDVCKYLRTMKRRKYNFSIHPLQLKFIYSAILDHLKHFDHYRHIYDTKEDTTK